MGAAESLYREMVSFGLSVEEHDGTLFVSPIEQITDALRAQIRAYKPELLALLTGAASGPAHHHRWLVTTPTGEVFSLSRTPPATLAEIAADYPGAQVEPEPELPPGPALHPDDMALAFALLRHWGETDTAIGQEWIDGLARDPERRRQMYAEAVRLGLATFDPEPEAIATATVAAPATGAVCARCGQWSPNPTNPTGGLGRCLTDAPASRKAGACWPWPDADVRCREFDPVASVPEAATHTARPTP
ncbi:hypothetical protein [Thiocapsa sp. UBA6158]|jgi:hypothetical protein|uniref:hypothetical protein n=1 Tax=Thiocapsa sp. UBA6158 TaxID=1947692 RepID=UPI0025DCE33E|nr:hypothetical protein [Thiocapsa sp. UBA6158]